MLVEIDPSAGFCFGVEKAVKHAELELASKDSLYCLGEIVHNGEEINRLETQGLKTIKGATFKGLHNATVLIRAHGEPPETYKTAEENQIKLIEATCPVVLKLQEKVYAAWKKVEAAGGTVVLVGKHGHPEIIGLAGQTKFKAIIVNSLDDIEHINFTKPIQVFAQTTFDKTAYEKIIEIIKVRAVKELPEGIPEVVVNRSICGQVSNRIPALSVFSEKHDVIIFVSGKNSSNGKALFEVCKSSNPKSYHIESMTELNSDWFKNAKSIGISGATSTPLWLMEEIANKLS